MDDFDRIRLRLAASIDEVQLTLRGDTETKIIAALASREAATILRMQSEVGEAAFADCVCRLASYFRATITLADAEIAAIELGIKT